MHNLHDVNKCVLFTQNQYFVIVITGILRHSQSLHAKIRKSKIVQRLERRK